MGGRLEAIAGSAEGLQWGTEAGSEERVERQAFQDGDWYVMFYTDGADTEENWWYRQEGGAAGAETLSQGTNSLWPRHQQPRQEELGGACGLWGKGGQLWQRKPGQEFLPGCSICWGEWEARIKAEHAIGGGGAAGLREGKDATWREGG